MKKLTSLILIIALCCVSLCGCTELAFSDYDILTTEPITEEDTGLTVHFIDVGQGDCTLIESKGHFALIDAGEYSEADKVISYLASAGVESLDFIISTHPHSDHCGGLSAVMRNFETGYFISPNVDYDSSTWKYVLDAADERGVSFETPELYDTYQVGAATLTVLSPASDGIYSDLNNYSIVVMAEYGNSSFLLTGDAEALVEKELVRSGYDLSADVLKCGHHGSSSSTCEQFLDAVNPSASVISCGADNDYGHPHTEVLSALEERNIPVWRTDLEGNIKAATDGENIYISAGDETVAVDENTQSSADCATDTAGDSEAAYIGNKNSKVYHKADCSSVSAMSSKNKVEFQSKEEAEEAGYKSCGSCNP